MLFRVDVDAAEPLFEQLAGSVRAAVLRGELTAGERLPAARDVAEGLGVNIHTVLRAYQQLRDERLIELRRGRGAVVAAGASTAAPIIARVGELVAAARAEQVPAEALVALIREEYR